MNNGNGKAPACLPTWKGHIETTKDALIIFEACFTGTLAHCFRRPHDRERNQLIVSGNVFVYEEATSGIKRWTDGIPWSPSRILTNFLIYRQLNNPFPPGEKKRATKRGQRQSRVADPYPTPGSKSGTNDELYRFSPGSPSTPATKQEEAADRDADRGLLGSLVDSYEFKENGLLKKTMTVVINNVQHHLVSYYSVEDAKYNLRTPRDDPRLKDIHLRDELVHQPKFKFPNIDDAGDGSFEPTEGTQSPYGYYPQPYDPSRHLSVITQGAVSHQEPMSQVFYPGLNQYTGQSHGPSSQVHYSLPNTPAGYLPMASTPTVYPHHHSQHSMSSPNHLPAQQSTQTHGLPQAPPQRSLQTSTSTHQTTHQMHPDYQQSSPYASQQPSPYASHQQAQQASIQQLSYPEQQNQTLAYSQHQVSNASSQNGRVLEYLPAPHETYSPNHEYYASQPASVAPLHDNGVLLPQPWQMSVPASYGNRADSASYPYRASS